MKTNYSQVLQAKTGELIPQAGSILLHSKYNPVREAENFSAAFDSKELFFIVGGIAGGFHINSLYEKNNRRFIIAVENSQEDIDYLIQLPQIKKLITNKRILFATPATLFNLIIENYLPAIYGNLNTVFLRSWGNIFPETAAQIKAVVNAALENIKADFSVQSRFGKIWQKNILNNLKTAAPHGKDFLTIQKELYASIEQKTAAIIAAGPTLDEKIDYLKENRTSLFIISTDTAYTRLTKAGITSDAVVSVDGQSLSNAHFLKKIESSTLFVMDLCSSFSAVKKILRNKANILFFESGHPLCQMAAQWSKSFVHLNTGSGTVTIAALDFAKKIGFKKYELFGADFAYSKGKAYTSGTYLDELYSKKATRLNNCETNYDKLLFRTELIKINSHIVTTSVMEGYKKSLEYYEKQKTKIWQEKTENFDAGDFFSYMKKQLKNLPENLLDAAENPAFYTLLPLISFYEMSYEPQKSYVLARYNTLQYN